MSLQYNPFNNAVYKKSLTSSMKQNQEFTELVITILRRREDLAELAQDKETFDEIINILRGQSENENPQSLPSYLIEQCGIKEGAIIFLVNQLINCSTTLTLLGEKIVKLWLAVSIYELVNGFTKNPFKRRNIQQVFKNFEFQGGNLENLIQTSFNSVKEPFKINDIAGVANELIAQRQDDLKRLFAKKQKKLSKKDHVSKDISSYNADKSAQEQLKDLIEDFHIFPKDSLERDIQAQLIKAHAVKFSLQDQVDREILFITQRRQLKDRYINHYGPLTSDLLDLFKKISSQEQQHVYDHLFTLRTKILPINVLELQRLINKTNYTRKLIQGQDIIFVIGNTGSGKSTNILKFLGYTLEQGEYNGLPTLIPVQKLDEAHKTFYTSPEAKSCTRYINAVAVPDKMYPKGTRKNKKTLILCDSPGFGDSAGVEVDIANGVGMINALHGAKSVRVVVILPYHSLLGDRMDGAIKMGEIISNLFYQLTILNSVRIFYNKVPHKEIEHIPLLINNKLNHLTQTQKSNQKLITFLEEVLKSSKNVKNFLNPTKDDYNMLFEQIFQMTPIQDAQKIFQYEFTNSTKKQIQKFAQEQRNKVKDYFMKKKYNQAKFHLKMLEILKTNLNKIDITNIYKDLLDFIQKDSASKFKQFEQLINQIMSCQSNASTEKKSMDYKEAIIQIHHFFHQFEEIQLNSKETITALIDENKKHLLEKLVSPSGLTDQTITKIKIFSQILISDIRQQAFSIINKNFSLTYQEIERLAKDKNYLLINEKIESLTVLHKYTIQLSPKGATSKMEILKKMLEEDVEEGIKAITQIINEPSNLTIKIINQVNVKIQNIKHIESLNFLEKSKQIRQRLNSLLKQIERICKKTVRDLENIRLTLNEEVQPNANIEENQLSSKKKVIEFLMKIDCIGENLKEDYDNAVQNISRKLKENVEILKNCIVALKGNNTEEKYNNMENIKKAASIVLRFSNIIGKGDEGKSLVQSIQSEFMKFLIGEIQIINNFEIILAKITKEENYFAKIKEQCHKIQTYAKMEVIGEKIKPAVEGIRNKFKEKLNLPLKQFLDKQIISAEGEKSYKILTFSLDKLEKLSSYLSQTEDNLSIQYRSQIKKSEALLADKLRPFFQSLQKDINEFLQTQFNLSSNPASLKELIKTLLAVNKKTKTCQFLNIKLDFDIEGHLNNIENSLKQSKEHLEAAFNSQIKASDLKAINKLCKYYSEVESSYKSSKFGFKQLQKSCSTAFTKSLQNDEDRIKELIRDIQPTKIQFQTLKQYYQQFRMLKDSEGEKKRRFIVNELKNVERNWKNNLDKFKKEIDNPDFINKDDFLKVFQEANFLVKQIDKLYSEEDKNSILIHKQDIVKIGEKIIELFKNRFELIYKQIQDYNMHNFEENIQEFGYLQALIYDAFSIDSKIEQNPEGNKSLIEEKDSLLSFLSENVKQLRDQILRNQYLSSQKIKAKNTKKLKILLEYLKKGTQSMIEQRYNTLSSMNFDSGFINYFNNCNKQQKAEVLKNISDKFELILKQYEDHFKNSSDDVEEKQRRVIEQYFAYLPTKQRQNHQKQFHLLKRRLELENNSRIEKSLMLFKQNPAEDSFFVQSNDAQNKNQKNLHQKCLRSYEQFFKDYQYLSLNIDRKQWFISTYILQIFQNNKIFLKSDSKMLKILLDNFYKCLKQLINQGKQTLKRLRQFFGSSQKEERQISFKSDIATFFKIFSYISSINDNFFGGLDISKKDYDEEQKTSEFRFFKQSYIKESQELINEILQNLSTKGEKEYKLRLSYKENKDPKIIKSLKNYLHYKRNCKNIIDQINEQVEKNPKILLLINQKLQSAQLQQHKNILNEYQKQFNTISTSIDSFEFYSQKKRNMAQKQIEEDIIQFDNDYRHFVQLTSQLGKILSLQNPAYNLNKKSQKIKDKFQKCFKKVKIQIQRAFQDYRNEPPTGINLFYFQLENMRKKSLKFIGQQNVEAAFEDLQQLLDSKFETMRTNAINSFSKLKQSTEIINREINSKKVAKDKSIRQHFNLIENTKQKNISMIENQFKERIQSVSTQQQKNGNIIAKKAKIKQQKHSQDQWHKKQIEKIDKNFEQQVKELQEKLNILIKNFSMSIKVVKKVFIDITFYKKTDLMDKLLSGVPDLKPKIIRMIQTSLQNDENDKRSIGKLILMHSNVFKNYQNKAFNKLIKGQGIQYVVKNIQKISTNRRQKMAKQELEKVQSCYLQFKQKYDIITEKYKNSPLDTTINNIVQEIKQLGKQIQIQFYKNLKPTKNYKNKLQLLAGVFALWAIIKAEVNQGQVEFTIEPHPAQITSLILLLGISQKDETLADRLAQVGTGQGKSIVLAGLSCYLALVGFKVRCACYSAYLSGRDQKGFENLFSKLGIQNQIKYGTFHQLCEEILNPGESNLKESVQKMILQLPDGFFDRLMSVFGANFVKIKKSANQIQDNPTILVIDEVDVFFDNDFFGKNYCPAITLKDPTVTAMFQLVWKQVRQKQKDIELDKLLDSQEFKKLVNKYPTLKDLLKNQVHGMVAGALNYCHDYVIIDKKLGYKDGDSISFKINYGYKTIFANMYQYERGYISYQSLNEALQIFLMVAEFSYSRLPEQFKNILGVTGTLEVLPRYKKQLLVKRYKFYDQYAIPSAFGSNINRMQSYILIAKENLYKSLINQIKQIKQNRPIIIFFKTIRELNQFYIDQLFEPYQARTNILTQEHDPSIRDSRILMAVEPRKITLMTNSFGRGTDFVVLDQNIKKNGGLHVIQAFLSLEESQEVQIKGRTARQSGKGSVNCIISESWLEQLNLKPQDIPKNATSDMIHTCLLKARQFKADKQAVITQNFLKASDESHDKTLNILTKPMFSQADLISYVQILNKFPEVKKTVIKTVLGMDATGSMSTALRKTCQIIGNAFNETYAVLQQKKVEATIEIKIMVYRNYDCSKDQILQSTSFENTPVKLKQFLERVKAQGGWGREEAVQVLFQSLNKEQKIDQVILIGDAAPNTKDDVETKRNRRGKQYWNENNFPATHIDNQIAQFVNKKCPVHSFYLNYGEGFKEISQKTQGQAAPFKIYSPTVTKDFTSFVVTNILMLIEKNSERTGLNLVQTYRKLFP